MSKCIYLVSLQLGCGAGVLIVLGQGAKIFNIWK